MGVVVAGRVSRARRLRRGFVCVCPVGPWSASRAGPRHPRERVPRRRPVPSPDTRRGRPLRRSLDVWLVLLFFNFRRRESGLRVFACSRRRRGARASSGASRPVPASRATASRCCCDGGAVPRAPFLRSGRSILVASFARPSFVEGRVRRRM